MIFLSLLVIPLIIALCFFIFDLKKITWQQFALHVVAQLIIAAISMAAIYHMNTSDVEIWNGHVLSKHSEKVHCRHSYECHCHIRCSGHGKSRSCYEHCDTCYEHSYDIDWVVQSNLRNWDISTVDRQGLKEPPRWTEVQVGDPVSDEHVYTNYIKGAPNTLFRYSGEETNYQKYLIPYEQSVYDYYKVNRVFLVNYSLPDQSLWNTELAKINSFVGYQRQCNIIVLFTSLPQQFFYALTQHWLGGKKNDVIVVIGATGSKINWVNIMAWTDSNLYKVKTIDDIIKVKTVDREKILSIISQDTQKMFIRKHMHDFKYLQASVTPSATQWSVAMVIGVIVSIAIGIFFLKMED